MEIGTKKDYYIGVASRNRKNPSFVAIMNGMYGSGNWTVEQLAEYLAMSQEGKGLDELDKIPPPKPKKGQRDLPKNKSVPAKPRGAASPKIDIATTDYSEDESIQEIADKRMAEYLEYFDADTPNDKLGLYELSMNEAELVKLHQRKANVITSGGNINELKKLTDAITATSRECRMLQQTLGIDRSSRGSGENAADNLLEMIQRAKTLLRKTAVPISCAACGEGVVNVFGYVIFHFDPSDVPWDLTFECPRCGTKIEINAVVGPDIRRMVWGVND